MIDRYMNNRVMDLGKIRALRPGHLMDDRGGDSFAGIALL